MANDLFRVFDVPKIRHGGQRACMPEKSLDRQYRGMYKVVVIEPFPISPLLRSVSRSDAFTMR